MPYKRLSSSAMLSWCVLQSFFIFQGYCCDSKLIKQRLDILSGSHMKLYNANAQTLLQSLKDGAYGYCGIMANFHPELYAWLCKYFSEEPDKAEILQSFLGMFAFTEALSYPVTAKYHLNKHMGIAINLHARSCDERYLSDYQKSCIIQMNKCVEIIKNIFKSYSYKSSYNFNILDIS